MNWTFCWLPFESSSTLRLRVFGDAEAHQPVHGLAPGTIARRAVQLGEVDELVEDRQPRVQPALLGEVAPRPAGQLGAGRAVPAHLAGVASRMPRQIRMVVVLPAPLAPRKPKIAPRGTLNSIPSSAVTCPKRLVTRSISRLTGSG